MVPGDATRHDVNGPADTAAAPGAAVDLADLLRYSAMEYSPIRELNLFGNALDRCTRLLILSCVIVKKFFV
jgi:hypothetical protein